MTTPTSFRRSARTGRHHWWLTLLDGLVVLTDLPGTLGDLVGTASAAVLDDPEDVLSGRRRRRVPAAADQPRHF
ncbi:hypothetical protein [Actinoplanes xinjiangensis]|uniref:hypothetical protein n=1 Tax=Actinoplanes xinjiangensis TaxID=512350 RepID=UPI00343F0466